MVLSSLILCAFVAYEVFEESVNLFEVGEEIFVSTESAFLDDPVATLAGLKKAEFVFFCDAAGGLGEFSHALDVAVFSFFKCALAAGLVNVSHVLSSVFGVFPFGVYIYHSKST